MTQSGSGSSSPSGQNRIAATIAPSTTSPAASTSAYVTKLVDPEPEPVVGRRRHRRAASGITGTFTPSEAASFRTATVTAAISASGVPLAGGGSPFSAFTPPG